jgi:hypothetical protein
LNWSCYNLCHGSMESSSSIFSSEKTFIVIIIRLLRFAMDCVFHIHFIMQLSTLLLNFLLQYFWYFCFSWRLNSEKFWKRCIIKGLKRALYGFFPLITSFIKALKKKKGSWLLEYFIFINSIWLLIYKDLWVKLLTHKFSLMRSVCMPFFSQLIKYISSYFNSNFLFKIKSTILI